MSPGAEMNASCFHILFVAGLWGKEGKGGEHQIFSHGDHARVHRGEEATWRPVLLGGGGGCSWRVRATRQGEPEATETTIVWAH